VQHPHRGVYLVGAGPVDHATRSLAAVLACGEGAWLSHRAAAVLWRLLATSEATIDVSVEGRRTRDRVGIRTHLRTRIDRRDRRIRDGVPVTAPALTLLDLAEVEPAMLERALNEARVNRLTSQSELAATMSRYPGHHGLAALLPLFRAQSNDDFSREEAEGRLWELIGLAALPEPRRNFHFRGYEIDFFWPDLRLAVELDGYRWHSSRDRLNRDRQRDAALTALGVQVLRFSYDQLGEPAKLVAQLAATIALASPHTA
jgi:very-short-patch-repair endonuclease